MELLWSSYHFDTSHKVGEHEAASRMYHSILKACLSLLSAYIHCTYIGPVSEMEQAIGTVWLVESPSCKRAVMFSVNHTLYKSNNFHCTHSEQNLKYIYTNFNAINCDHTLTALMCFRSSLQLMGKVYQLWSPSLLEMVSLVRLHFRQVPRHTITIL